VGQRRASRGDPVAGQAGGFRATILVGGAGGRIDCSVLGRVPQVCRLMVPIYGWKQHNRAKEPLADLADLDKIAE
jgi:hypothetical protein